jgi:hypothetical protein
MSKKEASSVNRREFLKASLAGLAAVPALRLGVLSMSPEKKTKIALIKTKDRKRAVKEVLRLFDFRSMKGEKVLVKPNFNTADPFPASTHNDTLAALIQEIKAHGARRRSRAGSGPARPRPGKSWRTKASLLWPKSSGLR